MTELDDDRDLAAAFASLRAPGSTADYASREPTVQAVGRVSAPRWPQALAGVLAVAVGLAGAGTFLALRNARQTANSATAGYPAARLGAAMAFDSTTGRTVMFGGVEASGASLSDTWAWDGSSWSAVSAGASPPAMFQPRLSDDPADGGVLLLGEIQPKSQAPSAGCAVASGSAAGGGVIVPNSAPALQTPPAPVKAPSSANGIPPVPSLPSSAGTVSTPPSTVCPYPTAPPLIQTWVLTATGWAQKASTPVLSNDTPALGAQLAYDAATAEVVAVTGATLCDSRLYTQGANISPAVMCPLSGGPASPPNSGDALAVPACAPAASCTAPCPAMAGSAVVNCPSLVQSVTSWSWSHGKWSRIAGAFVTGATGVGVVADGQTGHAMLITQSYRSAAAVACPPGAFCPVAGFTWTTDQYRWAGTSWSQTGWDSSAVLGHPSDGGPSSAAPHGFFVSGAALATSANGHELALTVSGEFYARSSSTAGWALESAGDQPGGRSGAAMAEGPDGSIVLFGGVRGAGPEYWGAALPNPGADTWTWDGSSWRHLAGSALPAQPTPYVCPDPKSLANPCVGKPVPVPQTTGAPVIVPPATAESSAS